MEIADFRTGIDRAMHTLVRHCRPGGFSIAKGCRVRGLARSTNYSEPRSQPVEEARQVRANPCRSSGVPPIEAFTPDGCSGPVQVALQLDPNQ